MARYRKKPVVIEAVQWTGFNAGDLLAFVHSSSEVRQADLNTFEIETLEGTMTALLGDWIIKGVKGEIYPCKPDIFDATYEPVEEATSDWEFE